MPSMVFPTRTVLVDLDGDDICETDITTRVVSSIDTQTGIFSYDDFNRLAEVGYAKFSIDNSDDVYSDPSSLVGKAIQVILTYGYLVKQVFFGHVKRFKIDSGDWGDKRVHLEAYDWMSIASQRVIQTAHLAIDKRIDEAVPLLLIETASDPVATDVDTGYETFPAVFDGVRKKTTVYSELSKLVNSELGWGYLEYRERLDGAVLRVESHFSRGLLDPVDTIPINVNDVGYIKFHDLNGETGYLKQHQVGNEGKIKIHERVEADFGSTMVDAEWVSGENTVNDVSVRIYPRAYDTTPIVLFNLDAPIYLGQTKKTYISGFFVDPDNEQHMPGFDVIHPVATTDFLANASFYATGTNLTSNITGSFFSYSPGGFKIAMFNRGTPGWLTFFQVRGYGIHKRQPIEYNILNDLSASRLKESIAQSFTREYSTDYDTSKTFADSSVALNSYPQTVMKSASFVANMSDKLMTAYMTLESGDKVRLVETQPNHTGSYYIQGVKSSIDVAGGIDFQWYVKESVETYCEPIVIAAPTGTASGVKSALDFGVIPYMSNTNMPRFTYSAWVRRRGTDTQVYMFSRSVVTDAGSRRGNYFSLNEFGTLTFTSYKTPTDGFWWCPSAFTTQNQWKLITVTYNGESDGADPKIYIGDQIQTVTEVVTPSGTTDDDSDCPFIIMNIAPDPATALYQHDNLADVDMRTPRVWNRELSLDEIRELNNNPYRTDILLDGLVFQGFYVPRGNRDDYINANITDQKFVLDAVHLATAIPYNQQSADIAVLRGREFTS